MSVATGHFSNNYTFTVADTPNGFSQYTSVINTDAVAVINYLSNYISWSGTLDFVVRFATPTGGAQGFGAYGGVASNGATFAASEAQTGTDANGADWDAGSWLYYTGNGSSVLNYGVPVYFDPNPNLTAAANIPAGQHDFVSIFMHETLHSLGFWSLAQHGTGFGSTNFDDLTVERNGQYFFTGANTHALLGNDLALATTGSRDHYGIWQNAPSGYPVDRGAMFEYGNYEENRWQLGKVDVAVLKDLGYTTANEGMLPLVDPVDAAQGGGSGGGGGGAGGGGGTGGGGTTENAGTQGDDVWRATSGSATYSGGAGHDKVVYTGGKAAFSYTVGADGTISVVKSNGSTDKLISVEKITFDDGSLLFDITSHNAPAAYRLYGGAFDRTPDEGGLRFWIDQWLDNSRTLHDAAVNFIASDEFRSLYGTNLSTAEFVNQLYMNVLGRGGEAGGIQYWNDVLGSGMSDRASALVNFTQLPEYVGQSQGDIANGYWVA